MNRIKVLFLSANPQDTTVLRLDEEIRAISEKIRASEHRDLLDVTSVWATRPDDLIQSLNEHKPHIVHFSGHGSSKGEIILSDDQGVSKPVSTIAIKALFQALADNVRVVVFNACYSRILALAVTEIIDCAIGMKSVIGDRAATIFSASFYRALGFGCSVEGAFEQGKVALLLEGVPEHDTPDLIVGAGVDPSQLHLLSSALATDTGRLGTKLGYSQKYLSDRTHSSMQRTGTRNLERTIDLIFQDYRERNKPISLIYIDLDKFTGINNRFGRRVGDEVIQITTKLLEKVYQNHHYIARWINDEFVVCITKTAASAMKSATHLQAQIQSYPWSTIAPGLYVTASLGIAQLERDSDAVEWILRAIKGAEWAKESGGNQTCLGPRFLSKNLSRNLDDYTS